MPDRSPASGVAQEPLPPAPPESWVRRFGRRNVAYILFVVAVIGFAIALEARDPAAPDDSGGVGLALMLWSAGSLAFFVVNAVLVAVAVANRRSPRKALIACALPTGLILAFMILAQFTPY